MTRLVTVLGTVSWGQQFLDGTAVQWANNVLISGHAQGAGHAAYLSSEAVVPAVLFSGPQAISKHASKSPGWRSPICR